MSAAMAAHNDLSSKEENRWGVVIHGGMISPEDALPGEDVIAVRLAMNEDFSKQARFCLKTRRLQMLLLRQLLFLRIPRTSMRGNARFLIGVDKMNLTRPSCKGKSCKPLPWLG